MSVKNFKFVSPGVLINEIDNSFIPKSADTIGPVVVGRARRGLAMQPTSVQSYSDFVEMFGNTAPGKEGGDIYRDGNLQAPMYGTYAAKAFLRGNVAPLTYVRVLGHQAAGATTAGEAGWQTENSLGSVDNHIEGGAYGLFVMASSSMEDAFGGTRATASLAAVWYLDSGSVKLKGPLAGTGSAPDAAVHAGGTIVESTSAGLFTVQISSSAEGAKLTTFSLSDNSDTYIRKVFNTNPQLTTDKGDFYPAASHVDYWLGETYDQETRDILSDNYNQSLVGFIAALAVSGSSSNTLADLKGQGAREATAGWFIGQDLGTATDFIPENAQKLFRLRGRGHGEYLNTNLKVSITNIRDSNSSSTDYGTFSVVLRMLSDSDNAQQVVERFDQCTLDPSSPNFVARKIGDKYQVWSESERRLKEYGEYPNQSKFIYIQMNSDVEAGATDPLLLPFGYYGSPKMKNVSDVKVSAGAVSSTALDGKYLILSSSGFSAPFPNSLSASSAEVEIDLRYPDIRLRSKSSDGGLSDVTNAHFGISTTRTAQTNRFDISTKMVNRLMVNGVADDWDPTETTASGLDSYGEIVTLDNVSSSGSGNIVEYTSGSREDGSSITAGGSYKTLLDQGYDSFTAPFWGGFDGFNIKLPDPLYNKGMTGATNENNSAYYSLKRAIDSVSDPEDVDMNLLVAPGITNESLTEHMVDICESRADVMALIDLPDVYIPAHEQYNASKADKVGTTPQAAATALRARRIDSSYGTTFYPWVQIRDENTSQLVWSPPTVAMMGVLASSERKSQLWFAPAGFNRGGLSDGAAGIPVLGVTEKLTSKQRDLLYEANINPIASFPSTGIVVFGQKTLQEGQSALDRINVRRLVIYLKKQISIISTKILFEQNVQTTWNRFKGLVEPFLANVKSNYGISDYRLILDESTTTPDLVDQNILYAKIMVKPARSIEFIAIDFVIASSGASFDD